MKRDIVIAIIIGFITGSVIAITAVNLPNLLKNKSTGPNTVSSITIIPTPKSPEIIKLDITSPKDKSLIASKSIEIQGISNPKATILISSDSDNKVREVDGDEKFSEKMDLAEGINIFQISSIDDQGNYITKELTVYYTSEKL